MKKSKPWPEHKRKAASLAAKARYDALPEEVKRERQERGRAAYRAKYPERAEVQDLIAREIAEGRRVPEPCDLCGGDAPPM